MSCFITGATGLLGRYLVRELLARGADGSIFVLVRGASREKLEELKQWWGAGAESVIPIDGDLGAPALGVSAADRTWLRGRVTQLFHLAALYDIEASADALQQANVAEHAPCARARTRPWRELLSPLQLHCRRRPVR